jgi:uncharacterized protein YjbI with pentapeptide repeats
VLRDLRLIEAELEDILFHDCKLDYANLREGCDLPGTDFGRAEMTTVDLRGSDLSRLGGDLAGLRGAIVDSSQLIDLAPRLAAAAGLEVEDRSPS